jgi:hypothetical protein
MPVRGTKPASPIREDLKELQRPIAFAGSSLLSAATPQDAFRLIGAGRKNLIINGDFRVSQRGDYATSAVTAGHDTYWVDRWMSLKDGTTSTIQRVTRTINGVNRNAARVECTVGGFGIFGFAQRIELQNIPVGEFLTVSCWVRTNHPFAGFRTNTFRGIGGDAPFKFNPDGSWNRVSWTFNSTGTVSTSPDILIVAYNGNTGVNISAGQYIEIADVQLEVGRVATPFEYRSYAEELQLCQRYFWKTDTDNIYSQVANGMYTTNNTVKCVVQHPVPMRTRPTVSVSSGQTNTFYAQQGDAALTISGATFVSSWTAGSGVLKSWLDFNNIPGGTQGYAVAIYRANGNGALDFNAEL